MRLKGPFFGPQERNRNSFCTVGAQFALLSSSPSASVHGFACPLQISTEHSATPNLQQQSKVWSTYLFFSRYCSVETCGLVAFRSHASSFDCGLPQLCLRLCAGLSNLSSLSNLEDATPCFCSSTPSAKRAPTFLPDDLGMSRMLPGGPIIEMELPNLFPNIVLPDIRLATCHARVGS